MSALGNLLVRLERLSVILGCIALFSMMVLITADVALRYGLNRPFVFTRDVVGLYLMPAVFFLVLSDSLRDGAQIRVTLLRDVMGKRMRAVADVIGDLPALAAFAVILYGSVWQGIEAFARDEVVAGSIPWRVWPSFALVAAGTLMLIVRLAATTVRAIAAPDAVHEGTTDAGAVEALEVTR
ncbi:TRAP transporter small permease [Acuticoccus sediminis]|uniref:TRAP transporter small permease protein n=1 Tax=Acuticoccus sediminis TaxID=2184697 RepID=A0A8B2NKM9_9HYPH|nr:TRAP transporter small permease [Acuticoccus sediminis]RAH96786.1 TRAP transporter small permease [Acuticoccus sediminis]